MKKADIKSTSCNLLFINASFKAVPNLNFTAVFDEMLIGCFVNGLIPSLAEIFPILKLTNSTYLTHHLVSLI